MFVEFVLGGTVIALATHLEGVIGPAIAWSFPLDAAMILWFLQKKQIAGSMVKASFSIVAFAVSVFFALKSYSINFAIFWGFLFWILTTLVVGIL